MDEYSNGIVCSSQIERIYHDLEAPSWAPWLRFEIDTLAAQKRVYPDGQFVTRECLGGNPIVSLSGNRINWDGSIESLGSWDSVAGVNHDYEDTYVPDGNTYVMMSMSVRHDEKRRGLSGIVLNQLEEYVYEEGIEHVIGDFRPSDFGSFKRVTGSLDFDAYVHATRDDGLPIDAWLRSMYRRGMLELKVDNNAMVVPSTVAKVYRFQESFRPEEWWRVTDKEQIEYLENWHHPTDFITNIDEVWECGQTGTWYLDRLFGSAVYIESNVWGEVPYE